MHPLLFAIWSHVPIPQSPKEQAERMNFESGLPFSRIFTVEPACNSSTVTCRSHMLSRQSILSCVESGAYGQICKPPNKTRSPLPPAASIYP